jgi:hypothetical protein
MLRGSCFVSVPSSEMELTSADFVMLRSVGVCTKNRVRRVVIKKRARNCSAKNRTHLTHYVI